MAQVRICGVEYEEGEMMERRKSKPRVVCDWLQEGIISGAEVGWGSLIASGK